MMNERTLELKEKVFSTESPSRKLIVQYIRALISDAKKLPLDQRDNLTFEIMRPFLQLNNPPEDDVELYFDIVLQIGGRLDILGEDTIKLGTPEQQARNREEKAHLWTELIQKVESLKE